MKAIVMSIGGSLLVPGQIDKEFIIGLKKVLQSCKGKETHFILVAGGGNSCREYQAAAREMGVKDRISLDRVGIIMTRANAELLRVVLGEDAHDTVLCNPHKRINTGKMIIAAGHMPGSSTDYDAVILAKTYGAGMVVNLFNQDYVYDKDPREEHNATPLPVLKWNDYLAMVGKEWVPGLHTPFDPIAAQEAKKKKLKVILANGRNFTNLKAIIDGKQFIGTVLQ